MKRIHYSWAVCLGCTLMLLVCGGLCVNAFSVAQPYILTQNGFTNTQTSMITTVRAVAYLLCMLLTPWFYGRLGYRLGTAMACLFGVISFVLFAVANSLVVYYIAGVLAGLAYGFGSMVPASILITRWFREKHGLALGLCAAGTGFAMIVFSPVMTAIIEKYSLTVCFFFLAGVSLVMTAAVLLLVRESPEQCGRTPYGRHAAAQTEQAQSTEAAALRIGKVRWVLLFVSMCFLGAIASPGCTHLMILFTTAGFRAEDAALSVSLFGLALMVGKCLYGEVCDVLGGWRANYIFSAILFAGLILCTLSDLHVRALMFIGAVLYGSGVPMSTVGISIWAEAFSAPERYDRAVRLFQTGYGAGALLFSFFPGMVADGCGSYAPAYAVFLAIGVLSIAVVQSTYRLKEKQAVR